MRGGVLLACHHGLTDEMREAVTKNAAEFLNQYK